MWEISHQNHLKCQTIFPFLMFSSVRSSRMAPGFSSDAWILLKGPAGSKSPFTQPSAQESKAKSRALRKTLLCHLSWARSLGAVTLSLDLSIPLTLRALAQRMHDLELAWGRSPRILHLHQPQHNMGSMEFFIILRILWLCCVLTSGPAPLICVQLEL